MVQAVIEFVTEPTPMIQRHAYKFMVQTKFLSEREVFAEAYLRDLVGGDHQVITNQLKNIIDGQMRSDYEKWIQREQDLTPVFMHRRATVQETSLLISEVFEEIARLEVARASLYSIGVQLEFAINCIKRTNMSCPEDWDEIHRIVLQVNRKYAEVCSNIETIRNPSQSLGYQSMSPNSYQTSMLRPPVNMPVMQSPYHQQFIPQFSTPYVTAQPNLPQPQQQSQSFVNVNNIGQQPSLFNNNHSPTNDRNGNVSTSGSILNGRANTSIIGPHKVSSTIINIIGKNVYDANMDALDQIQTWESQAEGLHVPIDYFLCYMEILLAKDMQCWWQIQRPRIHTWEQFKKQFLEDFGDRNRVIKAEQAIASLTQGSDETFQQLFLRFTKLMSRVKPEKPESDKLYILRSSLKPELRAACMSVNSIVDLKRLCQEYEGMQRMYLTKEQKQRNIDKIATIDTMHMETDEIVVDYWNNELEWNIVDEEDRAFVISESLDKRKSAMSQAWTKEQKKEWLSKQLCWNCEKFGHLQGQCDKKWIPHCAKCGNKSVKNSKECLKCSGNARTSM